MENIVKKKIIFSRKNKKAICRLRLIENSVCTINNKNINEYFDNINVYIEKILNVFKLFNLERGFGFICNVKGGGKSAQSKSIMYSLAQSVKEKFRSEFIEDDSKFKLYNSILRKNKLLTLDTRRNEPKKYGLKKARKQRQRSKR